jgi:hypothetical protein
VHVVAFLLVKSLIDRRRPMSAQLLSNYLQSQTFNRFSEGMPHEVTRRVFDVEFFKGLSFSVSLYVMVSFAVGDPVNKSCLRVFGKEL